MTANTAREDKSVTRMITPHDREVSRRLNAIYRRKKDALGLTQRTLAEQTGYSTSMINHHLHGYSALRNARAILNYAKALDVSPHEIDPNFEALYRPTDSLVDIPIFDASGTAVNRKSRITSADSLKGYVLGSEYAPLYPEGTLLLVSQNEPVRKNQLSLLNISNTLVLAQVLDVTQRSVFYSTPPGFDTCREYNIRSRKMTHAQIDHYLPFGKAKTAFCDVKTIAKVVGVEFP